MFILFIRIEEVDKLQILVREWYVRFQVDRKQFIARILHSVFIAKDDKDDIEDEKKCINSRNSSSSSSDFENGSSSDESSCLDGLHSDDGTSGSGGGVSEIETEGRENKRERERENPFWGDRTPDFGVLREMILALHPNGKKGQKEESTEADGKDGEISGIGGEEGNIEEGGANGESTRVEMEMDQAGTQKKEEFSVKKEIENENENMKLKMRT